MSRNETPTYGIHILKATALFFQILAHAHLWAVQSSFYSLNLPDSLAKLATSLGCFALMVPMTAGAVLRMSCHVEKSRVTNVDWPQVIGTMLLLGLFESLKQALVYEQAQFFEWNVLHMVALTVPLILFLGQFGMAVLWSATLTVLFATPFMIATFDPLEEAVLRNIAVPGWPVDGILFATLLMICAGVVSLGIARSRAFQRVHKIRMLLIISAAVLTGAFALLHLGNAPLSIVYLKTLGVGILAGGRTGPHIWGFFPWAGTVMLGFLTYDLILRTKAAPFLLSGLLATGILMLGFFFNDWAPQTFVSLSPSIGLTSQYMNRAPALALLVIGLFCASSPLAFLLERAGFEKGYVVALSRCILWIYIYQTSILVLVARFFSTALRPWLPLNIIFLLFAAFALLSSLALPLLLQRFPFRIHLQLRKKAVEA